MAGPAFTPGSGPGLPNPETANPPPLLPSWVNGYIGLPFREGGRERDGLDCWGLVRLVLAERAGIHLPAFAEVGYRRGGDRAVLGRAIREFRACQPWKTIPLGREEPLDLIWLRTVGAPIHFGLVVVPGRMLHVEEGCDSVLEPYTGPRWRRRILEIGRYVQ